MATPDFYYVCPDEMFTTGGAVSGGADTNYLDEWLVDGRNGRPVRATNGSPAWTVTNPAKSVSILAVCNHNVDAARAIAITGDITAGLTGPALPRNGIPLNPWVAVSPTSTSSLTLTIASNTVAVIIGEFIAGLKRTLERNLRNRPKFSSRYLTVEDDSEFSSLLGYDKALVSRRLEGDIVLTDAGLADMQGWWDSTRGNTRLSGIVPNSNLQDFWAVKFKEFTWEPDKENLNFVHVVFDECPRSRW